MRRLLLVTLVAALAGCGSDSDQAAAPQPATVTVTETATETVPQTPTTATLEPTVSCSTAGFRARLPEQELPEAVASVRQRIFDAAVACDYDTLQQIALERGEGFTFSYGAEGSAADFWRGLEESGDDDPMLDLVRIISIPHTRNETGSYAWPSAYDETPTDEDWQALVDSGLYDQAAVDQMRDAPGAGGYLGWRTAITADGDWQFFVAGD